MASVKTSAAFRFEKYKYVAGIDFGSITSGLSIAHVNDSRKIYTVKKWTANKSKAKQIFTSILYKDGDRNNVFIGISNDDSPENETEKKATDIYIPDIKQYLFDPLGNEKLNGLLPGLTIEGVVTDYIRSFVKKAFDHLKEERSSKRTKYFKKGFQDKVIYCINSSEKHQDILRRCFIGAGLIQESEVADRLLFLSDAEATAYHCIAWDRTNSEVIAGEEYLVCDIGHRSLEISSFVAETTEYLTRAKLVTREVGNGSVALDNNLRNYLATQGLTDEEIKYKIIDFNNGTKFEFNYDEVTAVEQLAVSETNRSDHDLSPQVYNLHIFMPAINEIIASISKVDNEGQGKYKKIYLSGKYSSDGYFQQKLSEEGRFSKSIKLLEYEPIHAISAGAVSFGFRTKYAQTPYFSQSDNAASKKVVKGLIDQKPKLVKCDFIVGIDFGTTYSGASYCHLPKDSQSDGGNKDIVVITSWPQQENNNQVKKAPTLIIYDEKDKKLTKVWGQEAREKSLKGNELLFGNFKLFLAPERVAKYYGENSDIANIREKYTLDKIEPLNVIVTYLKNFKDWAESEIKKKHYGKYGAFLHNPVFGYVLTVPAMWDRQAKDLMIRAALDAGIANGKRDHLIIITEPEAAALNCEREVTRLLGQDNKTFVVCDAGGGTVDLVTFQIKRDDTDPDGRIYQIDEGLGGTCGSSYLDENFKEYILDFYKSTCFNVSEATIDLRDVMNNFVDKIKPSFPACEDGDRYMITLPARPEIRAQNGRTTKINKKTQLVIPFKDMKTLFDDVIDKIIVLINKQIENAKKTDNHIDAILMVGGFSKSPYLREKIENQYHPLIKVGVPREPVVAVSKGAVSYALNPRMISSTHVGQSYALEVKTEYAQEDDPAKKVLNAAGAEYTKSRLVYFAKKRDELDVNNVVAYEKNVFIEYPNNAIIAIFSLDKVVTDEREDEFRYVTEDHKKILEVQVNMPQLPNRKSNDKIPFTVSLQLDSNGVKVDVKCKEIAETISAKHKDEDTLIYSGKNEPIILKSKFSTDKYTLS